MRRDECVFANVSQEKSPMPLRGRRVAIFVCLQRPYFLIAFEQENGGRGQGEGRECKEKERNQQTMKRKRTQVKVQNK